MMLVVVLQRPDREGSANRHSRASVGDERLAGIAPADLYEIIRLRYERRAILITSNRSASEWPGVFGDPLLASAAVDRLRHHAHIIEIDGPSYRDPRARQPAKA